MYPRKDDTSGAKHLQSNSENSKPESPRESNSARKGVVAGESIHMKVSGLIHRFRHNWGTPVLQYQALESVLHHSSTE